METLGGGGRAAQEGALSWAYQPEEVGAQQGKLCCIAEFAAQIPNWGAAQRAVHSSMSGCLQSRGRRQQGDKALLLVGDGEAALGTIKMHPYYAWVCMYV